MSQDVFHLKGHLRSRTLWFCWFSSGPRSHSGRLSVRQPLGLARLLCPGCWPFFTIGRDHHELCVSIRLGGCENIFVSVWLWLRRFQHGSIVILREWYLHNIYKGDSVGSQYKLMSNVGGGGGGRVNTTFKKNISTKKISFEIGMKT